MNEQETAKQVTIYVDGQAVQVPAGMNLIEAVAQVGKEVPHYCYHPKLSIAGNCRMCLVEVGSPMRDRQTGEAVLETDGSPKIGWAPKPAIACAEQAREGMHVRTESNLIKDCRNGVMEFLLVNHPLDCPICDQAGECSLQEFATDYGRGYSRFIEEKNVKPKRTRLGPRITLDDERCILCSRCVRFCDEIIGESFLGFVDRGSYSTLTNYPGKDFDSNYSLNTVDICPVGALTSTDFRFKMRVWFLKPTKSICTESSVGVNTEVWSREGKIYRITPRTNNAVNDDWMSDSGRELYKQVEADTRLKEFRVDGNRVKLGEALDRVVELFKVDDRVAYVGSAHASLEEQFLLKQLVAVKPGPVSLAAHEQDGDGFLISNDATPNLRGALVTGLIDQKPRPALPELAELIESGSVKLLFVVNEDLTQLGITEALLRKVDIVYLGTQKNQTSRMAKVELPMLTVFEKSGTFINQAFRLQKFHQVVPGPAGLLPDIHILSRLLGLFQGIEPKPTSLDNLWQAMANGLPALKGHAFATIPDEGVLLDASPYKHINFCEGETLHYNPDCTT
ncbi:MAG TPA: ferredoxin [Opitutae bacterium]|nr:ferredoxin [Opitutae bacterium]